MTEWIDLAERRAGRRVTGLSTGELLIVGGLRVWVAAFERRRCGLPELRWLFNRHGAPGAGLLFHHLLLQTATGAYRTLDVGCPCCPKVQMDEERLLAAHAALQHDCRAAAEIHLGSWMPRENLDACLGPARGVADQLAAAGFSLPRRFVFAGAREDAPHAEVIPIHGRRRRLAQDKLSPSPSAPA